MIRIHKPPTAPEILLVQGTQRRRNDEAKFLDGSRDFSFDNRIYGHPTVKDTLIAAQYGKCAFCERKVGEEGDIEHFRPKAASRQGNGEPLVRPGYYWLAYDWDNLLLSCGYCNQRQKQNYFPLADSTKRALSHHQRIEDEEPLFINPAKEDPAEHIGFREDVVFAVNGSTRGTQTIAALGLNSRRNLREERMEYLANVRAIYQAVRLFEANSNARTLEEQEWLQWADNFLDGVLRDTAKFVAMSRATYPQGFQISDRLITSLDGAEGSRH